MNAEMRAYLDAPAERLGTNCVKWDGLERSFGRSDLVAMWVADMDFRTVPQVREAILARAEHAIYGYTLPAPEEKQAEIGWLSRRHGLRAEPEWILSSPGVIDSLFFCVTALTNQSDSIVIQPPVYGPFFDAARLFDRKLSSSPLTRDADGRWRMDFEDLETRFASGSRFMILCSPHNPIGRVWEEEELQRLVDLANRYGVIIISDEIHADFTMPGHRQHRILNMRGAQKNCVMLTSATKSFNLAGLRQSSAIIPDKAMREAVEKALRVGHAEGNIFGAIAQTAAYTHGDAWMDAVVEYIAENRDYTVRALRDNLPQVPCYPQEGTYLMWLDFSQLGLRHEEIREMLIDRAHVAMTEGTFFGEEGRGWFRLNLATQRKNVEAAVDNILQAVRGL